MLQMHLDTCCFGVDMLEHCPENIIVRLTFFNESSDEKNDHRPK